MAYDKEFRPDTRLTPSPYHGISSEGSLSPDRSEISRENTVLCFLLLKLDDEDDVLSFLSSVLLPSSTPRRSGMSDEHSYPTSPNHPQETGGAGSDGKETGPTQTQSLDRAYRPPASTSASTRQHSLGRVQQHHGAPPPDPSLNGPRPSAAKDYRCRLMIPLLNKYL